MYNPLPEIVPKVEFPPIIALTLQVTAVFDDPFTVAVNCRLVEAGTPTLAGATLTVTGAAAVILKLTKELIVPPRPLFVTLRNLRTYLS